MGNRWLGWVAGVGSGVEDVRFGDLVELSRWTGVCWMTWPIAQALRLPGGRERKCVLESADGTRGIEAAGDQMWAFVTPEQIIYRIARWEWLTERRGAKPGFYPIARRILARHEPKASESAEGVALASDFMRAWNPLAKVVDVGQDVNEVMPGDWVAIRTGTGTHIQMQMDGDERLAWYSVVSQGDVMAVWPDGRKPERVIV